ALYSDEVIGAAIVRMELTAPPPDAEAAPPPEAESLGAAIEFHLARYFSAHGDDLPPPGLYDRVLRELERPLISICLGATRGNQLRAAHLLGLNRNTLRKKIRDLDLPVV